MELSEMVRELRAHDYIVLSPEEYDLVSDEQFVSTCGCGCMGVLEAHAKVSDPRPRIRYKPSVYLPPGLSAHLLPAMWHS